MASPGSSKRQLEKARQEKAAAKRERKRARAEIDGASPESLADETPQSTLLAQLAQLHEQFANGELELDDFEAAKAELTSRLRVD